MCLAIPGRVISVNKDSAQVEIGGIITQSSLQLIGTLAPGDRVLIHTGYVIQKISEEEAIETEQLIREIIGFSEPGSTEQ